MGWEEREREQGLVGKKAKKSVGVNGRTGFGWWGKKQLGDGDYWEALFFCVVYWLFLGRMQRARGGSDWGEWVTRKRKGRRRMGKGRVWCWFCCLGSSGDLLGSLDGLGLLLGVESDLIEQGEGMGG